MIPQQGQTVQIRFNNGIFFDAIVQEWSDQKSKVKLLDSDDIVIIQKTLQDVLVVKIIAPKQSNVSQTQEMPIEEHFSEEYATNEYEPMNTSNDVSNEFEELKAQAITPDKLKRMAELKDEMNKIEREETFKKLRTFEADGMRQVQYGLPTSIKVSGIAQHTDEEIASTDTGFYSELQGLFNKKH